jgi:hypothetical protein
MYTAPDMPLPWSIIDSGAGDELLRNEYERALAVAGEANSSGICDELLREKHERVTATAGGAGSSGIEETA